MSGLAQGAVPVPDKGAPDRCKVCGERGIMRKWFQDSLGASHGFYEWWCRRCIVEAQLAYATEQAARIPALKEALAILDADHG